MGRATEMGLLIGAATVVAACTTLLGDFSVEWDGATSSSGSHGGGGAGGAGGDGPACQAGWDDCDGNPADCETDVRTDAQNCGACGVRCVDGSCGAEGCTGVARIAQGPANAHLLVIYEGEIFWTAGDGAAGSVQKVSTRGGPVTTIAEAQDGVFGVAVNQRGIYWINRSTRQVMRADHAGGTPQQIYRSGGVLAGVAADAADVFWSQRTSGSDREGDASLIGRIAMPDQAPDPMFFQVENASPNLMALDAMDVYWVDRRDEGTVNRKARRGDGSVRLADQQVQPFAVAVDRTHVYWTNYIDRPGAAAVMRVPKDGQGSPAQIGSGHRKPYAVAVDDVDDYVYWTDEGADRVRRARKGDSKQEDLFARGVPHGIALDREFVYWVGSRSGEVFKRRR